MTIEDAEKFWSYVEETPQCWIWTRSTSEHGYGWFYNHDHVHLTTHRVAYALNIQDPGALHVLHKCDNPPCVRLDHLFLGTPGDNARDKVAKGRHRHGGTHLPDEQIREIRNRYEFQSPGANGGPALAREYGLTHAAVIYIVKGYTRIEAGGIIHPSKDEGYCRYGHEMTVENSYITSSGGRVCRTCKKLWARKKKASKSSRSPSNGPGLTLGRPSG